MKAADRDPWLLTPGPLTTSATVKAAMLHDWGSRDGSFIAINRRVRERLVEIAGGEGSHVCVPLQGSGTFAVEAMLGAFVPRQGKLLILVNGAWIIGDKENQAIVKKAGKQFFINARIDTHHDEVQAMLTRVSLAELLYSQQHEGLFADLPTLITLGLLPKDLEGTESTGYRFHVRAPDGGKIWNAAAEPATYGRSGKLSFFLDAAGVRSGDIGGKPLTPQVKN